MLTLTLLAKAYNNSNLEYAEKFLRSVLKDLKVETEVCGTTDRGWIQVSISGEDEKVAMRYLDRELGFCPISIDNLQKFALIKGRLLGFEKSEREIRVDIGVFSPRVIDAFISLQHLQAHLVDGRKLALKKIAELFGFCVNLPLQVKIFRISKEKERIEAIISEKQLNQYRIWIESLLDRLIVIGSDQNEIQQALRKNRLTRDTLQIESLGLFENAIVCKFGTDAAGLIPKIGRTLRKAAFSVFSSRKIFEFLRE
jgi:hypothetical protein